MRVPRTNLILIALVALAALLCGPAAGRAEDIFDKIKWSDKRKPITVQRAGGGGSSNLVLKVSQGDESVIVKFSQDVPMTINFADQMLDRMGIPVPKSLALPLTNDRAKNVRDAIKLKLKEDTHAIKSIDVATTITAFQVVKTFGSHGTVEEILIGFDTTGSRLRTGPDAKLLAIKSNFAKGASSLSDEQRIRLTRYLASVRALVGCVADSEQAKLLGKLDVFDAFLGNNDRFNRWKVFGPNWRNLMVGERANQTKPTFVAIDNFAFAPSLNDMAWLGKYDEVKSAWESAKIQPERTETKVVTAPDRNVWVKSLIYGIYNEKELGNGNFGAMIDLGVPPPSDQLPPLPLPPTTTPARKPSTDRTTTTPARKPSGDRTTAPSTTTPTTRPRADSAPTDKAARTNTTAAPMPTTTAAPIPTITTTTRPRANSAPTNKQARTNTTPTAPPNSTTTTTSSSSSSSARRPSGSSSSSSPSSSSSSSASGARRPSSSSSSSSPSSSSSSSSSSSARRPSGSSSSSSSASPSSSSARRPSGSSSSSSSASSSSSSATAPPSPTGTGTNLPARELRLPHRRISDKFKWTSIEGKLRDDLHLLLFTHLQDFVVPLHDTGKDLPVLVFTNFDRANLKVAKAPNKEDNIWTFAVVAEISKGKVAYRAFKIDWTKVKKNIEEGMKTAVNDLVSELPADPDFSTSSTSSTPAQRPRRNRTNMTNMSVILNLQTFKGQSKFVRLRNTIAAQAPVGSATVDAEALYVRLAYLATCGETPLYGDDAITKVVLKTLGPTPEGDKLVLTYVLPRRIEGVQQVLRRKD